MLENSEEEIIKPKAVITTSVRALSVSPTPASPPLSRYLQARASSPTTRTSFQSVWDVARAIPYSPGEYGSPGPPVSPPSSPLLGRQKGKETLKNENAHDLYQDADSLPSEFE